MGVNTARNPITYDLIKTKTHDPKTYETNWDLIFSKPTTEPKKEEPTNGRT
jgi:hypothetical protein